MGQSGAIHEPISETYLVNLLEKISDNKGSTSIKVKKPD
jgi:hypothetical protein